MTEPIYSWGIAKLETAPVEDGLTDVVKTIHWTLTATADDDLTASSYGSIGLEPPDSETFIAFEELTKAEVEGWLTEKLDVSALQSGLANAIDEQRTPSIVAKAPPWVE